MHCGRELHGGVLAIRSSSQSSNDIDYIGDDDYDYDDIDDDHDDFGGAGGATKRRSLPMGSSAHCTSLDICFYIMAPNLATHTFNLCKPKMSAS